MQIAQIETLATVENIFVDITTFFLKYCQLTLFVSKHLFSP